MSYNELKIHGTLDFPFELYHIDSTHPKYEMAYHWHTNAEIIFIKSGSLSVFLDNREYSAQAGDFLFVNPEVVHGAFPHDCVYECIVFSAGFLPAVINGGKSFISDLTSGDIYINEYFAEKKDKLHGIISDLFEEMKKNSAASKYAVLGLVMQFFAEIQEKNLFSDSSIYAKGSAAHIEKLKKVLEFIRSSFDKPITLDDMAASASMSSKYFCAFFKEMTHKTPVEYLITYRIERAARQLLTTDRSVTDIAFTCGFNDLSYFIKTFKQQKGSSPGIFRKQ